MLYSISKALLLIFFKIYLGFDAKGIEHIPKKGGFILASNHISNLDPLVLGVAISRKLNFMAKHDLFYNPLFSWWLSRVGAFPIKRGSVDISSIREAMRRIRNGNGLLLFPEGTRRTNVISGMPQGGIGFLAWKLNVPVVPAFISGTEKALPRGAKFIWPAKISVHFGKQISIERRVPYQDIAQDIMENIRHLSCEELN